MSEKNLLQNEEQAKAIANNLFEKFKSLQYLTTPPLKGQYNYNFQIKKVNSSVNIVVYYGKKGNKIILQGNQNSDLYKEISNLLGSNSVTQVMPINESKIENEPDVYIGVDESGKGDFFGPLIIAGFVATPEIKKELYAIGVQDSKLIPDEKVSIISKMIKEKFGDYFTIVQIYPKKYNELYEKIGNLNSLLAWGHSRCIENLLTKHNVSLAICDQFGNENYIKNALMKEGKKIELIQTTKAERYVGVAAASILARNAFIEWIRKTEEMLGLEIPKGASEKVKDAAKKIIEKFGKDSLSNYVKMHFKTYKEL